MTDKPRTRSQDASHPDNPTTRPSEGERRPRGERMESRIREIARRLLAEREGERGERVETHISLDTAREVVHTLLETGDKARGEMMKLLGREIRAAFTDLGLREELHDILTQYSLELKASVALKPLAEKEAEETGQAAPQETSPRHRRKGGSRKEPTEPSEG